MSLPAQRRPEHLQIKESRGRREVNGDYSTYSLRRASLRLPLDDSLLVGQASVHRIQVSNQFGEPSSLQRGGMICALPSAIFGEMALDPLSSQGIGPDVDGDAKVVARKAD